MKDPFPIPPPKWLMELVKPYAEALALPSLTLHAHEALFALGLYTFLYVVVSPIISVRIWPTTYKAMNRRTKVNWDVHIVSFFQSTMISILCFWIMFNDKERQELLPTSAWEARIWEYNGGNGFLQSLGLGYFMWDLFVCAYHIDIFGVGMLAHAICAITVFAFGYRPFVYHYAPNFLLFELSSPFLNIHWFCDKLDLTGSVYQAVNGVFLVGTFFGCRLVWGTLNSYRVFYDIYHAINTGRSIVTNYEFGVPSDYNVDSLLAITTDTQAQRNFFVGSQYIPIWLGALYLTSNLTLNGLNFFWFEKMIATIRKRFDPPFGTKGLGPDVVHWEPQEKPAKAKSAGSVKAGRERAEEVMSSVGKTTATSTTQRSVKVDGSSTVEVSGQRTLKTRRKA